MASFSLLGEELLEAGIILGTFRSGDGVGKIRILTQERYGYGVVLLPVIVPVELGLVLVVSHGMGHGLKDER